MISEPRTFVVTDPRQYAGDPFEVTERAFAQLTALLKIVNEAAVIAEKMALNTELERHLRQGIDPDPSAYANGPIGRRLAALIQKLDELSRELAAVGRAASYDSHKPPKED